jgi:hypothetical protein
MLMVTVRGGANEEDGDKHDKLVYGYEDGEQ